MVTRIDVRSGDGEWRPLTGVSDVNVTVNSGTFVPEYWANDVLTVLREQTITFDFDVIGPPVTRTRWQRLTGPLLRTWWRLRGAIQAARDEWDESA